MDRRKQRGVYGDAGRLEEFAKEVRADKATMLSIGNALSNAGLLAGSVPAAVFRASSPLRWSCRWTYTLQKPPVLTEARMRAVLSHFFQSAKGYMGQQSTGSLLLQYHFDMGTAGVPPNIGISLQYRGGDKALNAVLQELGSAKVLKLIKKL